MEHTTHPTPDPETRPGWVVDTHTEHDGVQIWCGPITRFGNVNYEENELTVGVEQAATSDGMTHPVVVVIRENGQVLHDNFAEDMDELATALHHHARAALDYGGWAALADNFTGDGQDAA